MEEKKTKGTRNYIPPKIYHEQLAKTRLYHNWADEVTKRRAAKHLGVKRENVNRYLNDSTLNTEHNFNQLQKLEKFYKSVIN